MKKFYLIAGYLLLAIAVIEGPILGLFDSGDWGRATFYLVLGMWSLNSSE